MAVGIPMRLRLGQIAAREEQTEGTAIALSNAYGDVKPENITYAPDLPFYPCNATSASLSNFAGTSGGPRFAELAFETCIAGSGTAGTAPAWGPLLKGCGFVETLVASTSATYTLRTARPETTVDVNSNSGQAVLSVASTRGFAVGDLIHIDKAGTGGGAETGVVLTIQDDVSLTLTQNLTFTHTALQADEVFPYPGSLTLGWYLDGMRYLIHGARGNVRLMLNTGETGRFAFTFRGAWNAPTDLALLSTITYDDTISPAIVSGAMSLDSQTLRHKSLEFDLGNVLADRVDPSEADGAYSVAIASREPVGTLDPEMLSIATYDFFNQLITNAEGDFTLAIGATAGNIVTITAPKCQYTEIAPGDRDGLQVAGSSLRLNPHRTSQAVTLGAWAGGVVTFTVATHGYYTRTVVIVSGCGNASYDGTYTIASTPTANTFTAALVGDPGAWTTAGVVQGLGDDEIRIVNT